MPPSPTPRLTDEQVAEIRRRYYEGEEIRQLAREYGKSEATISRIVHYQAR